MPAKTIHVETGKFSFEAPAGFRDITESVLALSAKRHADQLAAGNTKPVCVSTIYSGEKATDKASFTLDLLRLDMACGNKQPTDFYLKNFITATGKDLAKGPDDQVQPAGLYTLSVHRAIALRGSLTSTARPTQFLKSCVVAEGDVYCWTMKAAGVATQDDLHFVYVTFEGETPVPLVPAATLTN